MLAITRGDEIGVGGERGGEDVIIIRIVCNDTRHAGRLEQFDDLDIGPVRRYTAGLQQPGPLDDQRTG